MEEGNRKFGKWLGRQDWRAVFQADDLDDKVKALHELFKQGTGVAYDLKTRKKKSSEPVWMTEGLREMIRKRRRLFRKHKRRGNWISLKERIASKLKKGRKRTIKMFWMGS